MPRKGARTGRDLHIPSLFRYEVQMGRSRRRQANEIPKG